MTSGLGINKDRLELALPFGVKGYQKMDRIERQTTPWDSHSNRN